MAARRRREKRDPSAGKRKTAPQAETAAAGGASSLKLPSQLGSSDAVEDCASSERKRMEESVRSSEARLRAVVDTAVDAIVVIDEHGIIDSINPATEKLFGYTSEELVGRNVKMLMPSPYDQEHDGYLARFLRTGEKRIIGIGREVHGRRKDGLVFPVDLAVSEFAAQGKRMFTGLLRDVSARKQLEREVLQIAAVGQRQIGQQLHDSTGQELTALRLLVDTLAENLVDRGGAEATIVAKIQQGLDRVLEQIRGLSRGLIPVEVDSRGLPAALEEMASRTSSLQNVDCRAECEGMVEVDDNQVSTHLYYIAQEAVTNALRHGRPQRIVIHLGRDGESLVLRIRDDGSGIQEVGIDSKGMGLKIMRYRAGLINARLAIEPDTPSGTQVICTVNKGPAHGDTPETAS